MRNFIYIKRYVSQLSTATWIHFITVHSNTFEKTVLGYVQQIVTPPGARMMATTPPRKATQVMVEPSGTWACRLLQTTQRSDLQLVSHRFYNAPKLARRFRGIVARCRKMSQAPVKNTLCYSLLVRLHLPLVLTKYPCDSVYSALLSC